MNARLFETKREELTVTAEGIPSESALKEMLKKIEQAIHQGIKSVEQALFKHRIHKEWGAALETRRYRDPRESDPDYDHRLRELEGDTRENEPGFRNVNYPRPPKSESWQNKVLVGVAITVISAAIISAVTTYTAVATLTTQVQMYIQANDKRLDGDESRIHDTERRLDRGAP